jgi:hypothetical protein
MNRYCDYCKKLQEPINKDIIFKYAEEIQSEFDTNGHNVYAHHEIDGTGIRLDAALSIAEEADKEIANLKERIESLEDMVIAVYPCVAPVFSHKAELKLMVRGIVKHRKGE